MEEYTTGLYSVMSIQEEDICLLSRADLLKKQKSIFLNKHDRVLSYG